VLLTPELLPAIRSIGDVFVFHQDNAPAHRARDTVEFIIPDMWPGNSRDRNSVDYWISSMMQKRVSSTNPRYGRVAATACWDMGWISAQRGGRCD